VLDRSGFAEESAVPDAIEVAVNQRIHDRKGGMALAVKTPSLGTTRSLRTARPRMRSVFSGRLGAAVQTATVSLKFALSVATLPSNRQAVSGINRARDPKGVVAVTVPTTTVGAVRNTRSSK
jgi:hypothetical protein